MKDKFYVGQRVQKAGRDCPVVPEGSVGTIIKERQFLAPGNNTKPDWVYIVRFDAYPSGHMGDYPQCWCVTEDLLAPIYDGDQKISWSECVWNPLKQPV